MLFRPHAAASRGFVLIEVLVAVGIAAALMAVLIRSFSQTWSGIGYVREEAEGTLLARSMMAEALQRNKLATGSQEGVTGRYAWKMTTTVLPVVLASNQQKQGVQQRQQQSQQGQQRSQQGQAQQAEAAEDQANKVLYHLVLVLKGPSGRSNRLDTYEIGQPPQ